MFILFLSKESIIAVITKKSTNYLYYNSNKNKKYYGNQLNY
jgi:hypothetical protein